jgi:hypothetical protein
MSAATHDKLRRAQQLLRREIPDGNPSTIFDRALTLLLEDVARRKLAATSSPRPGQRMGTGSRHIPAHVRRTVWVRDGGQCAFVSGRGRRCSERVFLEFHHRGPYAAGGEATVDNISLHCRAHNAYEAELLFGTAAPHGNPLGDRRARAGPRGAKEARRGEAGVGSDASAGTRPGASCVRRGMGESVP